MALQTQALVEDALGWDGWEAVRCICCGWLGFAKDLEYPADESLDEEVGMNACPQCGEYKNGIDGGGAIWDGHGPFSWWEPEAAKEGK